MARVDKKTYECMIAPLPCGHPMANLNVFGGKTSSSRSDIFCCVCAEIGSTAVELVTAMSTILRLETENKRLLAVAKFWDDWRGTV
jgi:hypothetical protein